MEFHTGDSQEENSNMKKIWDILGAILRALGLQNVIIIEAERGTRENTQAVFYEMLRRKWDKRFKFLLVSKNPDSLKHLKSRRVSVCIKPRYHQDYLAHIRLLWAKLRAAMIIDENIQIHKRVSQTVHVFLTHGSPIKNVQGVYFGFADTDYMLNQSEFWKEIRETKLGIDSRKFVTLGSPRNDGLFSDKADLSALFPQRYNKVIVWYPTFRQRRNHKYNNPLENGVPIPLLHDEAAARRVNELARQYGVLLVVKPHPIQDLSLIKELQLDHLIFIYDDFFVSRGITAHEFLGKTDAMITDYSSIFFDYLLTGKPIALTHEDFAQYMEHQGFLIDIDLLTSCSTLLNTVEDFEPFFRDLVEGNDPLVEKRDEVMRLTNTYLDGNSTRRVVDWLETLLPYHQKGKEK